MTVVRALLDHDGTIHALHLTLLPTPMFDKQGQPDGTMPQVQTLLLTLAAMHFFGDHPMEADTGLEIMDPSGGGAIFPSVLESADAALRDP